MNLVKYPKSPETTYASGKTNRDYFDQGYPGVHAKYLVEMSFKHPVMYFMFYRWFIPLTLHKNDRQGLTEMVRHYRKYDYLPFWAEFSQYHPVLGMLYLIFQGFICILTRPVQQTVGIAGQTEGQRIGNGVAFTYDKLAQKNSDMPSD